MVLADQDSWTARLQMVYHASMAQKQIPMISERGSTLLNSEPKRYAAYTREYLGWGVFALMKR